MLLTCLLLNRPATLCPALLSTCHALARSAEAVASTAEACLLFVTTRNARLSVVLALLKLIDPYEQALVPEHVQQLPRHGGCQRKTALGAVLGNRQRQLPLWTGRQVDVHSTCRFLYAGVAIAWQ